MKTPALETRKAQLATARAKLDQALEAGEPTAEARRQVAAAEKALLDAEAAAAQPAPVEDPALADAAARLVGDAERRIVASLGRFLVPAPVVPALPVSLALASVRAAAEAEAAQARIEAHEGRLAALRARLADIEARRAALMAERLSGAEPCDDAADAAALALLAADAAGLSRLIGQAEQERPAPLPGGLTAGDLWRSSVDAAELEALKVHGEALQEALLSLGAELAQRARGRGDLRLRLDPRFGRACQAGRCL